jgi:hypothetical protein
VLWRPIKSGRRDQRWIGRGLCGSGLPHLSSAFAAQTRLRSAMDVEEPARLPSRIGLDQRGQTMEGP